MGYPPGGGPSQPTPAPSSPTPTPGPTPTPPSQPTPAPSSPIPTPVPTLTPPSPAQCKVGESVRCPGSTTMCAGNQCCPGGIACPSAGKDFTGCPKPKIEDCVKAVRD